MTTTSRAVDAPIEPPFTGSIAVGTDDTYPRISWGAVLAGAVIALALQLLFAMLGTGIGASVVDPLQPSDGSPSAGSFGIGAAVWWGISSLIALFAGGWIAGRLSGTPRSTEGGMHGLLTWAVAMLALVYLLSSATSSLMRGAAGVLGTAATVTATGAAAAAPALGDAAKEGMQSIGVSIDDIKREARAVLAQTGKPELQPRSLEKQARGAADSAQRAATSGEPDAELGSLLERLLAKGKDAASQVDRDAVINVLMARSGLSREEAAKRVQGWENTAQEARAKAAQVAEQTEQKARQVADATARNVSRAMLWGALALAIGGLAAWFGGMAGQRRVMTRRVVA